jgi:hypothetical protein
MRQRRLNDILDRAIHGFSPSRDDTQPLARCAGCISRTNYSCMVSYIYRLIAEIIALFVFIEKRINKAPVTARV